MADSQVTTTTMRLEKKLDGARGLRALILRHRQRTNEERQLPQPIVEAMARLGVFRSLVPASAGGEEWDWPTWMRVVEELSTVDGAVGWIAGVGGSVNAIVSGWVSAEVGRAVFCEDPIGLIAGAGAPTGTARPTDGGYLLSGRWQFGSGSPHACWFVAGYALEGEAPRVGPMMLVPAKDVEIIDTWSVGGMRSTGSHDFAAHELFVPTAYTLNAVDDTPQTPWAPLSAASRPHAVLEPGTARPRHRAGCDGLLCRAHGGEGRSLHGYGAARAPDRAGTRGQG